MQTDSDVGGRERIVHASTGEASDVRVVRRVKGGPLLVEGPVCIIAEDGTETESDRFVVAVCRCRRSAVFPLCDTSHRRTGLPRH